MLDIHLAVYAVDGMRVFEVDRQAVSAGRHEVTLDANSWSSGVYFIRMRAGGHNLVRKAVLVK